MMLPRNSTTERTCRDFNSRYCIRRLLTSVALQPGGEARRVEFVVLVQDGVDRVVTERATVVTQAVVGPGAQLELNAFRVEADGAADAREGVDGVVHVVGQ